MRSTDRRPLILLGEDDDDLRELIASCLLMEGLRVVQVEDGFELRDYLDLCRPGGDLAEPDVVVTDVKMPGMTGLQALSHCQFLHAPVVFITGHVDDDVQAYGARTAS